MGELEMVEEERDKDENRQGGREGGKRARRMRDINNHIYR